MGGGRKAPQPSESTPEWRAARGHRNTDTVNSTLTPDSWGKSLGSKKGKGLCIDFHREVSFHLQVEGSQEEGSGMSEGPGFIPGAELGTGANG